MCLCSAFIFSIFRPSPSLTLGEIHFINMILHKEFIPKGPSMNQQLYIGILRHMWEGEGGVLQVSGKDPQIVGALRTGMFPDDMPAHTALSILFLTENNMEVVLHPASTPSSPL
jgi:hypothetical protein